MRQQQVAKRAGGIVRCRSDAPGMGSNLYSVSTCVARATMRGYLDGCLACQMKVLHKMSTGDRQLDTSPIDVHID